jgi:hypothetical protein
MSRKGWCHGEQRRDGAIAVVLLLALVCLVCSISACTGGEGGGGGGTSNRPPSRPTPTPIPTPTPTPSVPSLLFIVPGGTLSSNSVVAEYEVPKSITGDNNIAPTSTLSGPDTTLMGSCGARFNPLNRHFFVADGLASDILEFAALAPGLNNVAPISTIAGANTLLQGPCGLALDSSGHLFVANAHVSPPSILEFDLPSAGINNVAPIATIAGTNTTLSNPFGLALDAKGNLYVSDSTSGILEFAPPPPGVNNVAPLAVIAGSSTTLSRPRDVAVDSTGNVFVADELLRAVLKFTPPSPGLNDVAPVSTLIYNPPGGADVFGIKIADASGDARNI